MTVYNSARVSPRMLKAFCCVLHFCAAIPFLDYGAPQINRIVGCANTRTPFVPVCSHIVLLFQCARSQIYPICCVALRAPILAPLQQNHCARAVASVLCLRLKQRPCALSIPWSVALCVLC